jgi:chromosome segregation ATPase
VLTIQSVLLVLLGLLLASLAVLLFAPAYRARISRLTADRVRTSLPLTEAEVRADRDRIRADNAIRVHKLQVLLEQGRMTGARQLIELNRRDGVINTLQSQVERLNSENEEARNARHVLEQTIADRVPRVEQRLSEAKKLLDQRDRDITALTSEATKTMRALDEALQINTQQRQDLERVNTVLSTRAAQNRDGLSDPKFDAEVALTSEIEALRARSRDQGALIARLQGIEPSEPNNVTPISASPKSGASEIERLRRELAAMEQQLKSKPAGGDASMASAERAKLDAELVARSQRIEDQRVEIAQLKGSLAAYKTEEPNTERSISLRDSKIAMKARLGSLQAQTDAQVDTIRKLRAELAASNERMARQAQHFMDEMRRLGAGTLPTSAPASPADRRQQAQAGPAVKRSLASRISEAKPELANSLSVVTGASPAAVRAPAAAVLAAVAAGEAADAPAKVSSFMKALGTNAAATSAPVMAPVAVASMLAAPAIVPSTAADGAVEWQNASLLTSAPAPADSAEPTPVPAFDLPQLELEVAIPAEPASPPARPRLLERLGATPQG